MKNCFYLIIVILTLVLSCQDEQPLHLDYCEMLKQDQSHTNFDGMDSIERKQEIDKRSIIFLKNFDLIVQKTKMDGFPKVKVFGSDFIDSCRNGAINITMIHMAQAHPSIFYKKEYVDLFKHEIDQSRLNYRIFNAGFNIGFMTHKICDSLKVPIMYAMKSWGIDTNKLKKAKFVKCDS